ncbi:hypothetical protein PAXRUDRAFT_417586 [Paxillus rubicundulus Ve08.2h10]|uniref:Uncharacterized protein n=1 Tax=Paxillus rubicundulus Ve08.2h10 TaxID=930991 RepID=A0A0D0CZG3_9AGAM|nr:hypothetical protein PAXRUDRAFT_417586 [Paxillus rubicundulus Ve08.2h10]
MDCNGPVQRLFYIPNLHNERLYLPAEPHSFFEFALEAQVDAAATINLTQVRAQSGTRGRLGRLRVDL